LPALILTDLMMPRMSGLELAARLHGLPETRGVPVWVMSHMDLGELRARPAVPGVTGFLEKPRDLDSLLRVIDRLTGS
jgi:CheY-like chemotaxis protein